MQPSDPFHPFLALCDEHYNARSRQTSASSIWAPQPQPPLQDLPWHTAPDPFARDPDPGAPHQPYPHHAGHPASVGAPFPASLPPGAIAPPAGRTDDVFGTLGFADFDRSPAKNTAGAIGDGRKKSASDFRDLHVQQLLRHLNLTSPDPTALQHLSSLTVDTSRHPPDSPDFSPLSATSVLLTPKDASPAHIYDPKLDSPYGRTQQLPPLQQPSLLLEPSTPDRQQDVLSLTPPTSYGPYARQQNPSYLSTPYPRFEPYSEPPTPAPENDAYYRTGPIMSRRVESAKGAPQGWRLPHSITPAEWLRADGRPVDDFRLGLNIGETAPRSSPPRDHQGPASSTNEPINFLSLLNPSSSPPYHSFVSRIIKSADQQASIFLQQKLKVADTEDRGKIFDAICARGYEMMAHRFGNWAVQRCLEAAATPDERRKIVECMKGRIVDLATNCYGCHVLQKALDCEEDIRLLIVSELLVGDPAQTLVNKHASHVWSKIMELTWTPPAPPIFSYVNKSLKGKWASLACHETGSLVVQHAFENLEDSAKDGIVDELLNQGPSVFTMVAKNQWGSYCVQHILEHGLDKHKEMTVDHLLDGLLEYATHEQGSKSVTKALKEGGKETLDRVIKRMCEPAKGARRAMVVDLALSVTGSQLIASVLPGADKDQRAALYDCIRGHIVTLRGCKTGSKVIWLFDRMRAYYGY